MGFHIRLAKPPTRPLRPMIPDNACSPRITAAAGTELAGAFSGGNVRQWTYCFHCFSFPLTEVYNPKGLHPSRGVAPSGFRPLGKILDCCLPKESGPYLNPSVAGHPLRPATHRRLGGPLPRQQANGTRANLQAAGPKVPTFDQSAMGSLTVCGISPGFPELSPTRRYVTHVLLTRSPLSRDTIA